MAVDTTIEEDHKRVARCMANDIVTGRKVEFIEDVLHPDYVWYGPSGATARGFDGYRALVGTFHSAFPDLISTVHTMYGEGEWVTMLFQVTGVNDGDFLGHVATHKSVDFGGMIALRFADNGKIIEQFEMFDWPKLMQQLGLAPHSVPEFA